MTIAVVKLAAAMRTYGGLTADERVAGRRPVIIPIPAALLRLAGRIGGWQRVRALGFDLHYAIEAARRDLGYRPRVGLQDGLRRTLESASGADA